MYQQGIKVFLSIAEHQSLSAAARALHYSQPTVSEHLNQLEKKLGIQLVRRERGARKVSLTPAGTAFIPLAQRYLEINSQMDRFAQSQERNTMRLAASSHGHEYIVSNIMHKLMQYNSTIELRLIIVERREMLAAIETRDFDVAFNFGEYPDHPSIRAIPLFYEERYILASVETGLPDRIVSPMDLDAKKELQYADDSGKTIIPWRKEHFPDSLKAEHRSLISSHMAIAPKYLLGNPGYWTIAPASLAIMSSQNYPNQLTYRLIDPPIPRRICSLLISNTYEDQQNIDFLLSSCAEFVDARPYLERLF